MATDYPWPVPPQRAQLIVRTQPGQDSQHTIVLEWAGEYFTGSRPATSSEVAHLADEPTVFATPGLLDVQINGYLGRGFKDSDLGPEGIRDLCWSILLSGTTSFLPTITTDAVQVMEDAMAAIDAACRTYPDVAAMVAGIHQEGPWISPQDGARGAHPRQHVCPPSLETFEHMQQAANRRIKLLTLAPEVPGAFELIRAASRSGVAVALGHHMADRETIECAIGAGATGVTHLGNGCQAVMPRHPNLIWEQAAEDRLYAGLIADGHHLPPATLKVLSRAKPGSRMFLVSDAIRMAGAPPGLYRVPEGIAEMTPAGRFGFYDMPILIGAAVPLARCLANYAALVEEGCPPSAYLAHVTTVPATFVGIPEITFSLGTPMPQVCGRGTPATFVVWQWQPKQAQLVPQRIILRGRTVYDVETIPIRVPFGRLEETVSPEEAEGWRQKATPG